MSYTHAESFIGNGIVIKKQMNRRTVHCNHFFELLRGNYITNSTVIIRHDILKELGLLTENPLLREDYEMWLRIARQFQIKGIDLSLIRYRIHPSNTASNFAKETLKTIRTVKSVQNKLKIPHYVLFPQIGIQYLKYLIYYFKLYK